MHSERCDRFPLCLNDHRLTDTLKQMPLMMLGRPIMHKQTAYGFYRPGAVALANTLADIPFSASRILVYNIIVYL